MAKSTIVPVRLNADELEWLDKYATQYGNRSEYIRYLIHKERAKRAGGANPRGLAYSSDARTGRPVESPS